jgi:hypothetical protein
LFESEKITSFLSSLGWDMLISMPILAWAILLFILLVILFFLWDPRSSSRHRITFRDRLKKVRDRFIALLVLLVTFLSIGIWQFFQKTEEIVIAGKVVNENSEKWLNERLVLVFLDNKEVGRAITQIGVFEPSREGAHDGLYTIELDNVYDLSLFSLYRANNSILGIAKKLQEEDAMFYDFPLPWKKKIEKLYLYHWRGEIPEGEEYRIAIPSKNTAYVVKVLDNDVSSLPQEVLDNPVELRENGALIISNPAISQSEFISDVDIRDISIATKSEQVEIKNIVVPINNCGGSSKINQKVSYSQTFVHEYIQETQVGLKVEIPLGIWLNIIPELQKRYGFEQGEINSQSIEYVIAAEPETNQVYTIIWKEIWETGVAEVLSGNDVIAAPFRVKTGLVYEIESVGYACE